MMKCATKEAWDILSEEFDWTESLLEKYQENLNWKSISENSQIKWNLTMLEKSKGKTSLGYFIKRNSFRANNS